MAASESDRVNSTRIWLWGGLGLLVTAVLASVFWKGLTPPSARLDSDQLLDQALVTVNENPAEAERLLRESIDLSAGQSDGDARLALATVCAGSERWDEGVQLFQQVQLRDCRTDLLMAFGRQAMNLGQLEMAQKVFAVVGDRDEPAAIEESLELQLRYFQSRRDSEKAVEIAQELVELNPGNPLRWWALFGILKAKKATPWIIETLRNALKEDLPPRDLLEFRHQLIEALLYSGDVAAGRIEIERLMEEDPDSVRMRVHQANLYRMESKPQEALDTLELALPRMDPEKLREAVRLRAILYLDLGRFAEAVADLEQAVEEEPFDQVAHSKLSDAYRGLKRGDLAEEHQKIADLIKQRRLQIAKLSGQVEREPDRVELYTQIADLHRELNEGGAAQRWERRGRDAAHRASGSAAVE